MAKIKAYTKRIELPGSERRVAHGATLGETTPASSRFGVTVRVRRQKPLPSSPPSPGRHMTHAEYAANHSAQSGDLKTVEAFARHFSLEVREVLSIERTVLLEGTAAEFSQAFGVELRTHQFANGRAYRGREGMISLPRELKDIVTGVFGLDNRRVAWPHVRFSQRPAATTVGRHGGFQTPGPIKAYYANQLAQLYDFPGDVDGAGQTIGIVELGGGFRERDLATYFKNAGVAHPPKIAVGKVAGGATNAPDAEAEDQPDIEVLLDMEVIGAVAPGAKMVVYFVKDGSDQQCLRGVTAAVHDRSADCSVLSLSWGGPEFESGTGALGRMQKQFQENLNDVLATAAHLGITVCVSSGDNASACLPLDDPDRPWDGHAHVSFPASSPYALACGGTHVVVGSPSRLDEETWHPEPNVGTGGGVSRFFPLPSYQQPVVHQSAVNPAGGPGRGVPDVSADSAQESGYHVLVDGMSFPDPAQERPPIGGTSAAAPLWAGLIARLNQSLNTRLGFVNPVLYKLPAASGAFRDVTRGSNGDYQAARGWDACTGLGTPNGRKLLSALKSVLSRNDGAA
jgi:kumamolisin